MLNVSRLIISFDNKKIRDICENRNIPSEISTDVIEELHSILSDIEASSNVEVLDQLFELTNIKVSKLGTSYTLNLLSNFTLTFEVLTFAMEKNEERFDRIKIVSLI